MTTYDDKFDAILRAVKTNLARITVPNGFFTTVVLVHDEDTPIRPGDYTGPILKLTVTDEDDRTRPGMFCETTVRYTVEGFLPNQTPGTIRLNLRRFVRDFKEAHFDDVYLAAADLANGGAGTGLVKENWVNRVKRQYTSPNGYFRAEVECKFEWRITP